jgi:oligoribonuclease (3'-5' exoribonuclease)
MSDYVYISIETTGLEVKDERIVEIAALKIDSKTKLRTLFHQYFNPQKERRNLRLWILEECNEDY